MSAHVTPKVALSEELVETLLPHKPKANEKDEGELAQQFSSKTLESDPIGDLNKSTDT
jgi:hypothetical protein